MNSQIQREQFDSVPEDDSLMVSEIKIEPNDIKNEINTDTEDCNDFPEHFEIKLSPHYVASLKTISEEEERLDKLLEEFEKKSLSEYNITEQGGTNSTNFEEDKSNFGVSDNDNVKGYMCSICKNLFFEHDHKLCMPSGEKTYICNLCKKSNSNDAHIEDTYLLTGDKPFTCTICKKSFCKPYSLKRHNNIHKNEKPFTCNICSKSFSQKHHLIRHIRLHTNVCDVCGKSFSQKLSLSAHTSCHTEESPFICNVCSMSFTQKCILIEHTRTHTNEKLFTCDICSKSFSQKFNLSVHKRTHTKDKPFICNICKKSFSHKSNLKRHMRSHLRK